MYFLERKEPYAMPNILGNKSFPVHTYRWRAIAMCEKREPLEKKLEKLNKSSYRITTNKIYKEGNQE